MRTILLNLIIFVICSNPACVNGNSIGEEDQDDSVQLISEIQDTIDPQKDADPIHTKDAEDTIAASHTREIAEVKSPEKPTEPKVQHEPIKSIESTDVKFEAFEDSTETKGSIEASPKEEIPDNVNDEEFEINVKETSSPIQDDVVIALMAPDHESWHKLVQKYVSTAGKVNYRGLKSAETDLDSYLSELRVNPPTSGWSRNEKLTYWINAYNAFTVKLILKHYPLSSITNLEGGKPWDVKWIELGGETYSLNQIENDIIRPKFNEPRIHFAVNCAAVSCPPLSNRAYLANDLNEILEIRTKSFLNNPVFNRISENELVLSKIFDWYREDFGDLISFVQKYTDIQISKQAKIRFMEYDWALNES